MERDPGVLARVRLLEHRVAELERRLFVISRSEAEQAVVQALPTSPGHSAPAVVIEPPPIQSDYARPPAVRQEASRSAVEPEESGAEAAERLERVVGTRVFAAVGAVVVVIGVGLFLKLAYDRGWMNMIPPLGKCLSGAAFGLVLIAAGELIRRRWGAMASAGLSAAGLGALFASVYAAHGVYGLLPAAGAFAALALVSCIGFLVAARSNLASIAVISLVAAYLNPAVIGEASSSPWIMPLYLLAILCTGLALSAWRADPFRVLRSLVWLGTLLYGGAWCMGPGVSSPRAGFVLIAGAWLALHLELIVSARRRGGAEDDGLSRGLSRESVRSLLTSFSTTIWTVWIGVFLLRTVTTLADWLAPGAAAAAAFGSMRADPRRVLSRVPGNDSERLAAALMFQCGALVIAAVALALAGWLEVVAWMALGAAAIGAGRVIRARGLDAYGLIVMGIGSGRLLLVDSPFISTPLWERAYAGLIVSPWMILMGLAAAAWAVAAMLIRPGERGDPAASAPRGAWAAIAAGSLVMALAHLALALVHPDAQARMVCLIWLLIGVFSLALGRGLRSVPVMGYGLVVLVAATLRFIIGAPVPGQVGVELVDIAGLVISPWTLTLLAGACAWFVAAAVLSGGRAGDEPVVRGILKPRLVAVAFGMVLVFAAFLDPRTETGSLSLAWLGLGFAAGMLHSVIRGVALDVLGLAGVAAAATAWGVAHCADWMSVSSAVGMHPGLWSAGLIGAATLALKWWGLSARNPAKPTAPEVLVVIVPAVALLLLIATSLEVARSAAILASDPAARRAAVSIWWGLVGVGLIWAGFARHAQRWRQAGLGLLGIATAKAVFFDLVSVPPVWRVASFVGLGLLMLGVAVAYARIAALAAKHDRDRPAGGKSDGSGSPVSQ